MKVTVVDVAEALCTAEEEPGKAGLLIAQAAGMAVASSRPIEVWLVREVVIVVPPGTTEEEVVGRVSLAPLPEDVLRI